MSEQWVVASYRRDSGIRWLSEEPGKYVLDLENAVVFTSRIEAASQGLRGQNILTLDLAKAIVSGEL